MRYITLSELVDESAASDEANKLGLDYMSFGRWGKNGRVTHVSKNGKLVPAPQKVGEPHPSLGHAARNVTRGRPPEEMPEPEYPIDFKRGAEKDSHIGQPDTSNKPDASLRATPLKKVSHGDYGSNEPASSVDPYSEDGYVNALDALSNGIPSNKFAEFMKPYMKDPDKSNEFFSSIIDMASDMDPDSSGYNTTDKQHNLLTGAGMAMKVLRRLSPNVNSLSSMMPKRTPDQLDDPEDFEKNRNLDNIESPDDEPFEHPDNKLYNNIINSPSAKQKQLQKFIRGKQ